MRYINLLLTLTLHRSSLYRIVTQCNDIIPLNYFKYKPTYVIILHCISQPTDLQVLSLTAPTYAKYLKTYLFSRPV